MYLTEKNQNIIMGLSIWVNYLRLVHKRIQNGDLGTPEIIEVHKVMHNVLTGSWEWVNIIQ